ncbi:MAG TPA: methyl-accepting chemotaxis protein [Pseudomonadota bacterium]|nr:methyl-accepting chemotaxis protein [Pseudomonadota bacterium]HQX26065.1 methyl-accepting chemotaxis protein [Pseudomonadota bacterium]HQY35986.1 methyl-accepting chemotaxis protein [Pseudomonadota bacterium]HRA37207.1 methyl-accepting chemotaxis protein [Pseudomonadota bacterium]
MSSTTGAMGRTQSSSIRFWIPLLLLALGLLVANTYFSGVRNEDDRQAITKATDVQVLSQQIATFAREAAGGNIDAFAELKSTRDLVEAGITQLSAGDPKTGMPAYGTQVGAPVKELSDAWQPIKGNADTILGRQQLVLDMTQTAADFSAKIPLLTARMEEIVRVLTERDAPASQIYMATRQMLLADRMLRRVSEILKGGDLAVTAADSFGRDAQIYGRVLDGLMNGSTELNIKALTDPTARGILNQVFEIFNEVGQNVDKIQGASTDLFEVTEAADAIVLDSKGLLEQSKDVSAAVAQLPGKRPFPSLFWTIVAGAAALLGLGGAAFAYNQGQRRTMQATADLNQRNQEAILRLLDEMGSLAEGDLTVKATVTEDITGAIADSINFAVEALRSLVTTINETAVQVAAAAQETQATAMHLAEAAEHQAQQITSASAAINEIAVSIDEVSKNSAESADVAQRSVQIASKGAAVVRQTIQGMDSIRDQIQETSKRIKRLGESSQEIGSIVELINDISEQTNILALNAAIQAASAGEAGRGFAVVADEVQRLAERASGATKRIETLVQTIQSDTNEAVSSMEQTTAEVVAGARLAEDAGLALGEIEKVSNDLADLIQSISESARQQSAAATNISATMNVIQEITTQTSVGASQTAESIGNLAQLAADLRRSVADFKLPG